MRGPWRTATETRGRVRTIPLGTWDKVHCILGISHVPLHCVGLNCPLFEQVLIMGLSGLEPLTSRLSVVRSSQLSYRPLWLRGQDLNLRPSGYEPDELPTAPPRDIALEEKETRPSTTYCRKTPIRAKLNHLVSNRFATPYIS